MRDRWERGHLPPSLSDSSVETETGIFSRTLKTLQDRNTASNWLKRESPWLLGLRLWPLADEGRGILAGLSGWWTRRQKHIQDAEAICVMYSITPSSQSVCFSRAGLRETLTNKRSSFTDSLVLTWISAASAGCAGKEQFKESHAAFSHTRETKHATCAIYVQISTKAARQTQRLMLAAKSKSTAAILNTSPAATDSLQK